METISITNRGSIRKFVDDVFIDTIENIYALFDLKISYYGVSIAYKNTGQLKKYKRGKILHNYLSNNELERISFFSVPDNFVTVSYDYLLSISINYKKEILAHQTIKLYLTHNDDTYIIEGDVEGENCFIVKIHMKEYTK